MMLLEVFKYVQTFIITWNFTIFKVKWLKNCLEKNYKIIYPKTAGNSWTENFGFQNHLKGLEMVLRPNFLAFYDLVCLETSNNSNLDLTWNVKFCFNPAKLQIRPTVRSGKLNSSSIEIPPIEFKVWVIPKVFYSIGTKWPTFAF